MEVILTVTPLRKSLVLSEIGNRFFKGAGKEAVEKSRKDWVWFRGYLIQKEGKN